jgi:thiamine-monophosphate kinase
MERTGEQSTPISKFGKFRLISLLTANGRKAGKTTVLGVGDDAAVIDNHGALTLVSTDLMLEGIHFNLIYSPLKHLGYKAVIRAISDIYAMNGKPEQVLISLGISSRFTVEMVEELYEGINLACEAYEIDLAGGDTTSSLTGLTIGVTGIGHAAKDDIITRSGASANDLICVTGDFGAAFMGLQLLERERKLFVKDKVTQPDLSGYEYIVGKQLKPELPVKVIDAMREAGVRPSAMIDVTDGLASDLLHICRLSGTGCRIYYSKVPIDYETSKIAEEFGVDAMTPALNGGEDYELLFTVPLGQFEKLQNIKDIKVIGHMTEAGSSCLIAGDDGSEVEITSMGWK